MPRAAGVRAMEGMGPAPASAQPPGHDHAGDGNHHSRGVQGPLMSTPEDEVIGVEKRRNADTEGTRATAQRGSEYSGGGEKEAQPGEKQSADAQAIVHRLSGSRG